MNNGVSRKAPVFTETQRRSGFPKLFSVLSKNSVLAQSRTTLRDDFGIELLGKAAIYSFSYQRMVTPSVGLHAGFAALGGSAGVVLSQRRREHYEQIVRHVRGFGAG